MEGAGEREGERRDERTPSGEIVDADKRVRSITDPADGSVGS